MAEREGIGGGPFRAKRFSKCSRFTSLVSESIRYVRVSAFVAFCRQGPELHIMEGFYRRWFWLYAHGIADFLAFRPGTSGMQRSTQRGVCQLIYFGPAPMCYDTPLRRTHSGSGSVWLARG